MNTLTLTLHGQTLNLLSERALFWQETKRLIFSDVHLGKLESLRAEGLNLPVESGLSDLRILEQLLSKTAPREVFILGDFIHHHKAWTSQLMKELSRFLGRHHDISWNLILGNHERGSLPYLQQLPLNLLEHDIQQGPFILSHGHQPQKKMDMLQISGHLHPVITLREGPLKMRCPCFVLSPKGLLLPSFGVWTGGYEVMPHAKSKYFAIAGNDIFEVGVKSF